MFWYAIFRLPSLPNSFNSSPLWLSSSKTTTTPKSERIRTGRRKKQRFHRPITNEDFTETTTIADEHDDGGGGGESDASSNKNETTDDAKSSSNTKDREEPKVDPVSKEKLLYTKHPPPFSPCPLYRGVLHIASGDKGAAAGTLFFQYVINQLIYAEMYQLVPWIHLNNITTNVYDEEVHGVGSATITVAGIMQIPLTGRNNATGSYPGRPYYLAKDMKERTLTFRGTGVWKHYLEPVSAYNPEDPDCRSLPLATLSYDQLAPGIQHYAPWAVRSWQYKTLPFYMKRQANKADPRLKTWYEPQRVKAHEVVRKYFRFHPELHQEAESLVPNGTQCLAMHIRHSDKAGLARRKLKDEEFVPYVQAYLDNGGDKVYLATDSSRVLEFVKQRDRWTFVGERLISPRGIVRSAVRKPVFRQGNHDRTNREVLVEILAMSRCQFLLHGFSAVSESAHYLNINLHNNSVDLEDPDHITPEEFGKRVETVLKNG